MERTATIFKIYEALAVPGLLQTREYATALITAGGHDVERLVEERIRRQDIFTKNPPPELWALIDECVLHKVVGGREVTRAQLAQLLALSEQPNVVIRVVPRDAGAHVGFDGSFAVMVAPHPVGIVAYAEAPGGGRLIATDEVREYEIRYERIGQRAHPATLSRDLIRAAMEET